MEQDIDKKLYNDYLRGNTQAFELLYLRYKNKIQYFIFNIIKDYQKAEDITQDVFFYVLKNKVRDDHSFKYYIYLIAKSRAISYLNTEKRRSEITERYLSNESEELEKDVLDIISKNEEKKELINSIAKLDDKYKNVLYLNKIEELSYQETASILNLPLSTVKTNIYRGKKELRKILIQKGFKEMNKMSKTILIVLIAGIYNRSSLCSSTTL